MTESGYSIAEAMAALMIIALAMVPISAGVQSSGSLWSSTQEEREASRALGAAVTRAFEVESYAVSQISYGSIRLSRREIVIARPMIAEAATCQLDLVSRE